MGIFFKKKTRQGLDRKKVVASYTVLGICILLMAVNVGSFIFFPRLMAPLAILLSNAITLILALDTRAQTEGMPADIDFTFKLEQMEYAKKGYVVKEEPLEAFSSDDRFRNLIPDVSLWNKMLDALSMKDQGVRKVLYIKKYYYKVSIGIDFSKIKFSFADDKVFFSGVKFTRLHDISSELTPDGDDIDHCWILNSADKWSEIKHSAYYDAFKEAYARMQEAETRDSLEAEVESLCQQYTLIFRRSIQSRFPQVSFVESIEDSDRSWYALREGGQYRMVRDIAANMLLLTNVINETKQIEEQASL